MKFVVLFICCFVVPSSWCQPEDGDVRLAYGGLHVGLLQVFWNGTWGTVNKTGFTQQDGDVACRHLGFSNTKGHLISMDDLMRIGMNMSNMSAQNPPPANNMPPMNTSGANMSSWLGMPECNGNMSMMLHCMFNHLLQAQCTPMEHIHLQCLGDYSTPQAWNVSMDVQFRLVDGNETSCGRLEINRNGTWQPICANILFMMYPNFTSGVCKHLGYGGGGKMFAPIEFMTPTYMSDVQCTGNEMKLYDCPHNYYMRMNRTEDVWMACACNEPPTTPKPTTTPKPNTPDFVAGPACKKDKVFNKYKKACEKWLCKHDKDFKKKSKKC